MKLLTAAVILLACAAAFAQSADEKAIRDLDQQWAQATQQKNADKAASFYAADACLFPPGSPVATGTKQIQETWKNFLGDPNIESVNFGPNKIEVAKSGDMAYDTGWTEIKSKSGTQRGKYVVVWKKIGGKWKAVADIFNEDK